MVSVPRRALILARISDARDGDTKGVDAQVSDGEMLASRLGWTSGPSHTHVIVENDTSAFKRRKIALPDGRHELRTVRPGFRRALAMLVSGDADGLIAIDLDRACRDPRDLEDLIDVVESKTPRIPVESVTGSLRLASDGDITMARVMVAVANKSSRDTARRVARARRRQAEAGKYGGGRRPYGFERDGVTIRPAEAAEITAMADALLAGVSLRYIVQDLRQRGVPTATGAANWNSITVRDILLRPRNAGLMVYRETPKDRNGHSGHYRADHIIGEAPWAPILPEPTWRAVCSILNDPARRQTPGNTPRWLGSLLYQCGVCGDVCRVHAVRAVGGQYRCQAANHLARSATRVDEWVTEVIAARLARPNAASLLAPPPSPALDTAALRREAASLRELLDEQARLHARSIIDSRQLAAGSGELRTRLGTVEAQLTADEARDPLDQIAGRPDAAQVWRGIDLGRRRAILAALVTITLHPARPGRQADGGYFDRESIGFDWHR